MSNVSHSDKSSHTIKIDIPSHIAIIMDGNGRWAKSRNLPRIAGHRSGVNSLRNIIQHCAKRGVKVLTVFAFSSENWKRPENEVSLLMKLFITALEKEIKSLNKNNVKLIFIGDRQAFNDKLQDRITESEQTTRLNTGLVLAVAANYGGRWDITQAVKKIALEVENGELSNNEISEDLINKKISLAQLPEPDLFIRTGGEKRISNFLLWQLAYTELYFSAVLWPDFNESELELAIENYSKRQRRFGYTSEQVEKLQKNA